MPVVRYHLMKRDGDGVPQLIGCFADKGVTEFSKTHAESATVVAWVDEVRDCEHTKDKR